MYVCMYYFLSIVQQKQHESQQVKLQHMQEFVDKFRYNAKRASLVHTYIHTYIHIVYIPDICMYVLGSEVLYMYNVCM
jgi:hypothetical protein